MPANNYYCNAGMLESGHSHRYPHVQTTQNQEIMTSCLRQMMTQLLDGYMSMYSDKIRSAK